MFKSIHLVKTHTLNLISIQTLKFQPHFNMQTLILRLSYLWYYVMFMFISLCTQATCLSSRGKLTVVFVYHRSVSMAAVYQLKIKYDQDKFRVFFLDAKRPVSFALEDKHVACEWTHVQWNPAITKCQGTEKSVRYSGVFVIRRRPCYNDLSG